MNYSQLNGKKINMFQTTSLRCDMNQKTGLIPIKSSEVRRFSVQIIDEIETKASSLSEESEFEPLKIIKIVMLLKYVKGCERNKLSI